MAIYLTDENGVVQEVRGEAGNATPSKSATKPKGCKIHVPSADHDRWELLRDDFSCQPRYKVRVVVDHNGDMPIPDYFEDSRAEAYDSLFLMDNPPKTKAAALAFFKENADKILGDTYHISVAVQDTVNPTRGTKTYCFNMPNLLI